MPANDDKAAKRKTPIGKTPLPVHQAKDGFGACYNGALEYVTDGASPDDATAAERSQAAAICNGKGFGLAQAKAAVAKLMRGDESVEKQIGKLDGRLAKTLRQLAVKFLRKKAQAAGVEEEPAEDEAKEDEAAPKASAQVLASLYSHAKAEQAYIEEELGKMDHPGVSEALTKYKDESLAPRMEGFKAMLGEHHPDADMEKMCKGMETDGAADEGAIGEAGMVDGGDIPADDEVEEEFIDPEAIEADEDPEAVVQADEEEMVEADESETGMVTADETEMVEAEETLPEEEAATDAGVVLDEDPEADMADVVGEPGTDEILERYRHPKSKQWATRLANASRVAEVLTAGGSVRRTKDGRRFLLAKGLRGVKVIFEDGSSLSTSINGTDDEIKRYYLGKYFNVGSGENDSMKRVVKVEFVKSASPPAKFVPAPAKKSASKPKPAVAPEVVQEFAALRRQFTQLTGLQLNGTN